MAQPEGVKQRIIFLFNKIRYVLALIFVNLLLCAVLFDVLEKGKSFGNSIWWALVTAFTVGYGDISPATAIGKVVGAYLMISMWFLFALLLALLIDGVRVNRDLFSNQEQVELMDDVDDVDHKTEQIRADVRLILDHLGIKSASHDSVARGPDSAQDVSGKGAHDVL